MTKTISSARCVVEFLKVMSTPLPTFGLPSKQQDENENPLLPGGLRSFAETPSSSNCSALASTPSLQSSNCQPGAATTSCTASPTTSVCSSKTSREAFVTPGYSPELVISGHLRQLERSLDCTSVASPSPREDDDEQEDLSLLQAQAAENWTAWRSEGYKSGLDKLKERFAKTDSMILEVSDDDNSRIEDSPRAIQTSNLGVKVVDELADSFLEVREKFGNLSGSRIEDLSASELEELLGELSKVEKESLENVKKEFMVRKKLSVLEVPQEHVETSQETSLKLDKSLTIGVDEEVSQLEKLDLGPVAETVSYEGALNSLRLKFKDLSAHKVEELDRDQAEDLISDLRLLHVQMIKEKRDQHFGNHKEKTGKVYVEEEGVGDWKFDVKEEVEEVKPARVKVELHEAVNSTLAPQSMPPPPAPSELSPIKAKPNEVVESKAHSCSGLNSCLRGSRGFLLVQHSLSWNEEAKIHYFPRVQGWASVPKEGGATLGMAAKHCFEETIRLREEGEESGRVSPDITAATDQYANREMKKSTRSSSRLSMSMTSLSSSSSSSAYSSASSSFFQPSLIEEDESFCPPPPPPPQPKTAKSIKKGTRSSVRLSVAPCLQDEWRSPPTKPGILKLSRLPAVPDSCSPTPPPSSDSSLSSSTSLNSSRGGKGELGTRGLVKVGSRARKQLLKQAGVEVDPGEGEELRRLRVSRSRTNCGCDCEGHCGQQCPCVQGGIPCHEEEPGEPCGCNQSQCGNPSGRYRFDQTTVEMHFAEVKMGIVSLG